MKPMKLPRLGLRTDTGDVTGTRWKPLPSRWVRPSCKPFCRSLWDRQMQLPPMYSAVKINGQPLYKAARKGQG